MISISRPVNLRDLGGYVGYDGKIVKNDKLLRSGEVTKIDERDKIILIDKYELKTIVDFRSEKEVEDSPDEKMKNVKYHHIDIMKNEGDSNLSLNSLVNNITVDETVNFMKSIYKKFITDEGAIIGYREFIDLVLEQKEGSILFHCYAGKDRTGFAAAILFTILGVSKRDIFHDYLLTNKMRVEENKKIISKMKSYGMSQEQVQAVELALNVDGEYLESAYREAEKNYGSLENYIIDALKVNKEKQEYLIDKLVH